MDPGCLPTALQGLTDIEEMVIAKACPIMCVYRKHGGQRGYNGHVLNLPQDSQGFLPRLPRNVAQLPYLIIRKHGADNTHRDCTVRRQKVLEAITWLKDNNPFYADIQIDYEALNRLPIDGVPLDLPTAENPEPNAQEHTAEEDTSQNNDDGEDSQHSHSFLPLPQAQQSEQDAIRALINGEDPLDWPSNADDPINEFRKEGFGYYMALPSLFPYGKGDPTSFLSWKASNTLLSICITPSISILGTQHETTSSTVVPSSHLSHAKSRRIQFNNQATLSSGRTDVRQPDHESPSTLRCKDSRDKAVLVLTLPGT